MNAPFDEERLRTLEDTLGWLTVGNLTKLASLTGERVPAGKSALVSVIARHLTGERLRKAWESLDEWQQAAVAEVVHSPSRHFTAGQFRAKYGRDPDWGSSDRYGYDAKPSVLCLFFCGRAGMPADLKAGLLQFVPAPRAASITVTDPLPPECGAERTPLAIHERERAAQRELLSVLRLVDAGKVSVSDKTRRATAGTIQAITAILAKGDYYPHMPFENKWEDENAGPILAFSWPLLIQAGGLVQLSGSRLQLTKAGRKALSEPAPETIRALWTKWEETNMFDELARIECVKGQSGKGRRGLTVAYTRREAIASGLAECPPGAWIAASELFRFLEAAGTGFAVAHDPWSLYVGELRYGSLDADQGLPMLAERYLFGVLLEYAATLGMVDVALIPPARARRDFRGLWGTEDLPFFSRYDGLMYFRLTPLGAYCLDVSRDFQPTPAEVKTVFRVLPNLEIAAVRAELEQSDRLALDAYAIPVSDFVWRLEAGKLLAAIEAGRQLDEIRTFLEARNGGSLPGTVRRLLDDVAERATVVGDRGLARLVECASPELATLIASDSRTHGLCMQAGEKHLVAPASSEAAFRRALREIGYLLAERTTSR